MDKELENAVKHLDIDAFNQRLASDPPLKKKELNHALWSLGDRLVKQLDVEQDMPLAENEYWSRRMTQDVINPIDPHYRRDYVFHIATMQGMPGIIDLKDLSQDVEKTISIANTLLAKKANPHAGYKGKGARMSSTFAEHLCQAEKLLTTHIGPPIAELLEREETFPGDDILEMGLDMRVLYAIIQSETGIFGAEYRKMHPPLEQTIEGPPTLDKALYLLLGTEPEQAGFFAPAIRTDYEEIPPSEEWLAEHASNPFKSGNYFLTIEGQMTSLYFDADKAKFLVPVATRLSEADSLNIHMNEMVSVKECVGETLGALRNDLHFAKEHIASLQTSLPPKTQYR